MAKADNMLSILWLLRSGKQMTAQRLADELEIHIRTVYRCIDALCASRQLTTSNKRICKCLKKPLHTGVAYRWSMTRGGELPVSGHASLIRTG